MEAKRILGVSIIVSVVTMLMMSMSALAQTNPSTITVWGKIKYTAPGGIKLPFGLPSGMKIRLSGNGYDHTIETSGDLSSALATGKFELKNVPLGTTMQLEISFESFKGQTIKYSGSYKFNAPDLNLIQKVVAKKRAWEIAGYTADFVLDDNKGQITSRSRY